MFGVFKIKYRREHKSHKLDLKRDADGQISGMRHLPNYNLGKSDRYVFTWLVQWDFLLTIAINKIIGNEEALFLIRDIIPLDWWNHFNRQWLYSPTTSHSNVQEWLIDMDFPEQAVRQIESILNRIKAIQKTFKAKGYIPVAVAKEGISYSEYDTVYIDSLQDGTRGGKPNYNTF